MQGSDWGNRQEIEAEAARLLVRLHSEPSEFERSQIYAWIETRPTHAVAFAKAEAAWEQAERLKASSSPSDFAEELPVMDVKSASTVTGRYRGFMIGGMIAASLLIAGAGISTKISGSTFGLLANPTANTRCDAAPIKE